MGGDGQDQPNAAAGAGFERQHRMGGKPGKQGAGARPAEERLGQGAGGPQGNQAESSHPQRVARKAQRRRQDVVAEARPGAGQRLDKRAPGLAVGAEIAGGGVDGALQHNGGAIVQRVGQRRFGVDPFEAVPGQGELFEARRTGGHGVDGGTEIVDEAGKRQLGRARAAADFGSRLVDGDGVAGAREQDGAGQPVGAAADYDGSGFRHGSQPWLL